MALKEDHAEGKKRVFKGVQQGKVLSVEGAFLVLIEDKGELLISEHEVKELYVILFLFLADHLI